MSQPFCGSCTELKEYAPSFTVNGVTDAVAKSLRNNTGLVKSNKHNNCEDLNDVNDCLIGRMAQEVDAYDVCDWKQFMKKFTGNLYEVLKAMIASECGLWCKLGTMMNGFTFQMGETPSSGGSYLVAGKGVSFLTRGQGELETDAGIRYIGGAMMVAYGSLTFHVTNFTDADGTEREGNPVWAEQDSTLVYGNELVLEYRIKMSEYPEIRSFSRGIGYLINNGADTLTTLSFTGGEYAYGPHGACKADGEPAREGNSPGVLVPSGWTYLQLRMNHIDKLVTNGESQGHSLRAIFGIRLNMDEISC